MNRRSIRVAIVLACSAGGFIAGRFAEGVGAGNPNTAGESSGQTEQLIAQGATPPWARKRPQGQGQSDSPSASDQDGVRVSGELFPRAESIMSLPNPVERAKSWMRLVEGFNAAECEALVIEMRSRGLFKDSSLDYQKRYSQNMLSDHHSEYTMLLAVWAKADPKGALRYAMENIQVPTASETILACWAMSDPHAAVGWVKENQKEVGQDAWMSSLIRGAAATDFKFATTLLEDVVDSVRRKQAVNSLVNYGTTMLGAEAAKDWALSIKEEDLGTTAITQIAYALAHTDPRGFADWLCTYPSKEGARAMGHVMARMTLDDPKAACDYLVNITIEEFKAPAFDGVIRSLGPQDLKAAAALIDANPEFISDSTCEMIISRAGRGDVALGASMISRIRDEERRTATYERYFRRWLSEDMDAAVNWRNQQALPEASAQLLDAPIQKARDTRAQAP